MNVQPRFHRHVARFTSRAARDSVRAERSRAAMANATPGRPTKVLENVFADLPPSGAGSSRSTLGRGGDPRRRRPRRGPARRGRRRDLGREPRGGGAPPAPLRHVPAGTRAIEGLPDGLARVRVHARGLGRPRPVAAVVREGTVVPVEVATLARRRTAAHRRAGRDPVARARVDVLRLPEGDPIATRRTLRRGDRRSRPVGTARTGSCSLEDLADGDLHGRRRRRGRSSSTRAWPVRVRCGDVTDVLVVLVPRAK